MRDVAPASIRSVSMPHSSRLDTSPPSWPTFAMASSVVFVSSTERAMPYTSSCSRVRPNSSLSNSDSHVRNRGQARVQMSHPRSPMTHWSTAMPSPIWTGWKSPAPTAFGAPFTRPDS